MKKENKSVIPQKGFPVGMIPCRSVYPQEAKDNSVITWFKYGMKALNPKTMCFESASDLTGTDEDNPTHLSWHIVFPESEMPSMKECRELVDTMVNRSNFKDRILRVLYHVGYNEYPIGVVVRDF